MTQSLWSWVSWPMSSCHHFLIARIHLQCHSKFMQLPPPGCAIMSGGGRDEESRLMCLLFYYFSQYEPHHLGSKVFLQLFCNLPREDFTASHRRMKLVGSCDYGILCPVMAVCGTLPSFAPLLCPDPGPSLKECWPLRPYCYICPFSFPSGGCTTTLHSYYAYLGNFEHQTMHILWSCSSPILSPLLTLTLALSDVSMCGSFKCVCVMSRKSFVELQLSNQL